MDQASWLAEDLHRQNSNDVCTSGNLLADVTNRHPRDAILVNRRKGPLKAVLDMGDDSLGGDSADQLLKRRETRSIIPVKENVVDGRVVGGFERDEGDPFRRISYVAGITIVNEKSLRRLEHLTTNSRDGRTAKDLLVVEAERMVVVGEIA